MESSGKKSCLRNPSKPQSRPTTAPASVSLGSGGEISGTRKKVSFAPDTKDVERDVKYSKTMRNMRRKNRLCRDLDSSPEEQNDENENPHHQHHHHHHHHHHHRHQEDHFHEHQQHQMQNAQTPPNSSSSQLLAAPSSLDDQREPVNGNLDGTSGINIQENPYVTFTGYKPEFYQMDQNVIVVAKKMRIQRLFKILNHLQKAHSVHPTVPIELKVQHLHEKIFKRHVIALDLALCENIPDIMKEVLKTILKTTNYIIGRRSEGDYNENFEKPGIIPPCNLVRCLNKISGTHSRFDTSFMRIETIFMKLILEILVLTMNSTSGIIYDRVLNVIPSTAQAAIDRLNSPDFINYPICWMNNSEFRQDYEVFLATLGFTDIFGCKTSLTNYKDIIKPKLSVHNEASF